MTESKPPVIPPAPPPDAPVDVAAIEGAQARLVGQVVHTPLVPAARLNARFGIDLRLKLETLQATGSFKDRGACNFLECMDGAARSRGVIAASAGNHAQGVAYHARRHGVPAVIVMPRHTPFTKVLRTEGFGAEIVLDGDSVHEAQQVAAGLAAERDLTLIPPFDHPWVIAGPGTIGLELLQQAPDMDVLVIPVGGGGLAAGVAMAVHAANPRVRILGVQTRLCPAMLHAIRGEAPPPLRTDTLADGIAVKGPGRLTTPILAELLDEILLVDEPALERAVQQLLLETNLLAEGAGAAGVAALLTERERFANQRVVTILCGGNIDGRLLSTVLLRGMKRDGRITRLTIDIQDTPGTMAQVTGLIGSTGADIVDISHQRLFADVTSRRAHLEVVLETRSNAHVERLLEALQAAGYPAQRN